jgi:sulfide:quinone oxidoreductase
MKKVLILGAGTAGTIMANTLSRKAGKEWSITVIDQSEEHYYQPGFLFMPFGVYTEKDVVKPRKKFLPGRAVYRQAKLERILHEDNKVLLQDGEEESYDILIIGTGCDIAPDEVEGLTGDDWGKRSHDFYTFEGARKLAAAMADWKGGRIVINIAEMPIKCPVAPLEFAFLADWHLTQRGLRDKTEIVYATPLSGAFTKPIASAILNHLLEEKNIKVEQDFAIGSVDNDSHEIVSWDERKIDYDLLVSVPTNMGSPLIERSGLGDELNFVPTNRDTLQAKAADNIFVIGDATDLPTSKAGSVAHFEAEVLTANILRQRLPPRLQLRTGTRARALPLPACRAVRLAEPDAHQPPRQAGLQVCLLAHAAEGLAHSICRSPDVLSWKESPESSILTAHTNLNTKQE